MAKSDWRAISFYTKKTGYEKEIEKLIESLRAFHVPFTVFSCEPRGTWRANLNYKSEIILKAMDEFPDKDIVFLDADAVMRQYPSLFDVLSLSDEYDIAVCYLKHGSITGNTDELLSGTLWINNKESGRALIEKWHALALKNKQLRHQYCLDLAITSLNAENSEAVKVYRLPYSYTCIFDFPQMRSESPVIEHYQASRRFRRDVGFGEPLINLTGRVKGMAI